MDWNKHFDKLVDNLISLKWWIFVVGSLIFVFTTKLSEYVWAGIAAGFFTGRVFEYYTARKNGNQK